MKMKGSSRAGRLRSIPSRGIVRQLGILAAGGTLLQATAGGCSQTLESILTTLGQDAVSGIGSGISDLTQVLVIHLFL
jgi:hypothetical protein